MQVERHKEPTGCTFVLKDNEGTLLASCQVIGSRSIYFDGQRVHPERDHGTYEKARRIAGVSIVDRACRELAKHCRVEA